MHSRHGNILIIREYNAILPRGSSSSGCGRFMKEKNSGIIGARAPAATYSIEFSREKIGSVFRVLIGKKSYHTYLK